MTIVYIWCGGMLLSALAVGVLRAFDAHLSPRDRKMSRERSKYVYEERPPEPKVRIGL